MTRVCVITPSVEPDNGWGRYSAGVLPHLRERYDVTLVTDIPAPNALFGRPDAVLAAVRRVRKLVSDVDALLSLVSYPYSLIAYLSTVGTTTPYFVCCHGSYAVKPLHGRSCVGAGRSLEHAADVFPVSRYTAGRIREALPTIDNVHVTRNGIDATNFERTESFDVDHEVMLSVGPLKPRKGYRESVTAFSRVCDDIPDIEYHIVGGSGYEGYKREVMDIAAAAGIEDRVHAEGFLSEDELKRWYETADVFALTSQYVDHRFEGFPLVYLEAQHYGLPAIGVESSSASEAIAHEWSGLCVHNDVEAIGDAIRRLFTDDDLRDRLSTGATEWASEHPWSKVADVIGTHIDATLNETPI